MAAAASEPSSLLGKAASASGVMGRFTAGAGETETSATTWADCGPPVLSSVAPGTRHKPRPAGKVTDDEGCALFKRKRRSPISTGTAKSEKITSCNFYCPDGKGGWEKDYLEDGAPCNYNSEKDWVCKGRSCWLIEPESPTAPTNPVDYPDTNPSLGNGVKPKKPRSKKKKSSSKNKSAQKGSENIKKNKNDTNSKKKKKSKKIQ